MTDDFDSSTGLPSGDREAYLQLFLDETSEQLDGLVDSLLVLEQDPDNGPQLNEAFRLIHSIKGSAAMMGLESITILTHRLENHFERLRSGLKTLHPEMMALILKCIDFLRECNEQLRRRQPLTSAPELLEELDRLSSAALPDSASRPADKRIESTSDKEPETVASQERSSPRADPREEESEPPVPISGQAVDESEVEPVAELRQFRITVRLEPELPLSDVKAELIRNRLTELGTVLASRPTPVEFHRLEETPLLRLVVESERSAGDLRAAADVGGVASVEVEAGVEDLSNWLETNDAPVPPDEQPTPFEQTDAASEAPPHSAAAASDMPTAGAADTHANSAGEAPESRSKVAETLRVDVDRLDHLMNLAGELVVNQARFVQIARQMGPTFKKGNVMSRARSLGERARQLAGDWERGGADPRESGRRSWSQELDELEVEIAALEEQAHLWEESRRQFGQMTEAIDQLARVSKSLQRAVLDTRMVPVAPLFNRFRRVVRDISSELGKQVTLEIRGEKTELDKRMIDELNDPLVHLVRNAIDHGIESGEVRRRAGKPVTGVVRLEAAHSGNNVFITVSDDGGGIPVDRVRERIVQRGIVSLSAMEQMPDEQVVEYIWHPGFSTAAVVSGISGRGVGMDIVKTRIAGLNGTVAIDHAPGRGTRFTIRLPLTLAIIRSLLFRLRDGIFAVPIENVREIVAVPFGRIVSILGKRTFDVRGTFIPLVDIDDIFDWHDRPRVDGGEPEAAGTEAERRLVNVVVLHSGNRTLGLQVAELLGGQDIVIKSLAENFVQTRGLSGASILGDGSVCLLLDVAATIDLASRDRAAVRGSGRRTGTA